MIDSRANGPKEKQKGGFEIVVTVKSRLQTFLFRKSTSESWFSLTLLEILKEEAPDLVSHLSKPKFPYMSL
ncbi:hypothetical protein E1B28_010218 [Marasmius oreades]|uniref:Uncharacterized protein n=1 Tax=Marasmius oreades TaxID=181124 RepID=A0A9P7RWP5_9AGAR|nr:uncharacterized protein E1B28_010218 [Marasmius oreades]KAG7091166.1 hypothetical protein E1B28_010218 [Marasmius oreades]